MPKKAVSQDSDYKVWHLIKEEFKNQSEVAEICGVTQATISRTVKRYEDFLNGNYSYSKNATKPKSSGKIENFNKNNSSNKISKKTKKVSKKSKQLDLAGKEVIDGSKSFSMETVVEIINEDVGNALKLRLINCILTGKNSSKSIEGYAISIKNELDKIIFAGGDKN